MPDSIIIRNHSITQFGNFNSQQILIQKPLKSINPNQKNYISFMQRQPSVKEELSRKSCGILYHLKKQLQKHNLKLEAFISQLFGFAKTKFSKKDFEILIKKYDQNLVYDDIDLLFEELDDCQNGFVFFQRLKEAYSLIDQKDNPFQKPKSTISKIISVFQEPSRQEAISELRSLLLASQDLFQIIDLFASQTVGFLTVANVIQIFNTFEFNRSGSRKMMIEYLFENKNKIQVETFIQKLKLESAAKRIDLAKLQKSRIHENKMNELIEQKMKSKFVQQKMRQSARMEESFSLNELDLRSIKSSDQFINIDKIPVALQMYFNYGSVLEPQFAIMASEYIQNNGFFIDTENPPYSKANMYIHYAQITGDNYSLFRVSESLIFRDKNRKGLGQMLESKDIIQGALGDCYFMSAISAIVDKYPELVYRLFVLDKNPSHLYGVRLFVNGIWKTILLDLTFPIDKHNKLCAAQPYKHQVWVMLLEKAWAKIFGSYDSIHAGYNEQGLNAIAGAPSIHVSSRDQGFLKTLEVHLKKGAIITCATSAEVQQMTDIEQDNLGIYSNHAYTLLSIFPNLPYNGSQVTLLRIRNPWGRKEWKGDWSYYSSVWTSELKQRLDYNVNPKDGSFYMSYQNFMMYFDFVNICQVNLAYVNSYLTFEAERDSYNIIKLRISQKGDYFFTQYQQNPRKYKQSFSYQKSKSWMFLLKKDKDKRSAIGSKTTEFRDNTLEATLQSGEYILISKINWKYWNNYHLTLTSYGPAKVDFVLDRSHTYNPIHELSQYIDKKSMIGLGKVSNYDKIAARKRIYMDATEGYGFLEISNFQNRVLQTQVRMNPCKGINILPPYNLPMVLEVFPNQSVLVKFVVDPSGYNYQYSEKYLLY